MTPTLFSDTPSQTAVQASSTPLSGVSTAKAPAMAAHLHTAGEQASSSGQRVGDAREEELFDHAVLGYN